MGCDICQQTWLYNPRKNALGRRFRIHVATSRVAVKLLFDEPCIRARPQSCLLIGHANFSPLDTASSTSGPAPVLMSKDSNPSFGAPAWAKRGILWKN